MKFENRTPQNALGWRLAHSLIIDGRKHAKGTLVDAAFAAKAATTHRNIQVFLLEVDDVDEDQATIIAAHHIAGKGVHVVAAGRGRANLVAATDGLFIPGNSIDTLNIHDDAFSAASLPPYCVVHAQQLVATIKLIPYGLNRHVLNALSEHSEKTTVRGFSGFKAALISTTDTAHDKVEKTLQTRLTRLNAKLSHITLTEHHENAVADAINGVAEGDEVDVILVMGASAISDKRDVIPAALIKAGGTIIKLGMPTDPGNLLMLGNLKGCYVIGLPGCARSPALNGLDWILERIAAGINLDHHMISMMGTGGLLKEIPERQVPRQPKRTRGNTSHVAALVLAAGKASRARGTSKLLSKLGSQTVIETTLSSLAQAKPQTTLVVTGHAASSLRPSISAFDISEIHNDAYADGMGSSLAWGIHALKDDPDYIMVCLADMPFVRPETYKALIQAAADTPDQAIIAPTFHGKRGHPVLWHKSYHSQLAALTGDIGGKHIMQENADCIIEVPVDDAGILIDLDTPEMLKQFGVTPVAL